MRVRLRLHGCVCHSVFSRTLDGLCLQVHSVKLLVPMACCDEAATHLIQALGGEDVCKRVVGGTKWWQVCIFTSSSVLGG